MTRIVAPVLALLIAGACARDSERRLSATFDEAKQALRRGELEQAQSLADRGLSMASPDSVWAWRFRLYRGEVLVARHQSSSVLPLLDEAVPPGAAFDPLRARQKYLAALVQIDQNHLADALTTLEAARRIAPDASDVQIDIGLLDGQARMRLGKWTAAESKLNDAVGQAAALGDRFRQAKGWNDLGMGGLIRGRWDEALARFERVLAFTDLEQMTIYAAALSNAGLCYARLGEFDRALVVQRRAVDLYARRGKRGDFASALGELGNTYAQQGAPASALEFYQQALAVTNEMKLQAPGALWAGNLASANIALGDWTAAERFNDEARRLKEASRTGNLAHNILNAAQIARGRGQLDAAERLFQQTLETGAPDLEVSWSAHAGLADIAIARAQPAAAARHFEAALASIEKTRAELLKTDYKLTFLTRLIQFYRSYVDALVDQGQAERALEIAESSRGRVLAARNNQAAPAAVSAAALRQAAGRSHAVLLSYWLAPARSYLWVVTADGVRCLRLPPAKDIEALVRQYKDTVNNAFADPLASATAGDRLFDLLVRPAASVMPAGTHVVIAADGALHGINFETLPVAGATRHYWIEDVEIQATPGLAMLSAAPGAAVEAPSLLLIGDPVPHAPEFPALKYASAEIANVSKHFPRDAVVTFTSDRASPAAYQGATPERFTFVHFTAHAAPNMQSPLDSAVILSGPGDRFKLYARDVAQVPLHASLVTVSACRSAGERAYSGEGLVGFAWAFLRAGASRVIAGLWDVDDRSTAELMDHLYSGMAAGQTAARALREAKLSMLAKGGNYGKPYYWGPFQLFTVVP
jgi:CHAT domain-containing protein